MTKLFFITLATVLAFTSCRTVKQVERVRTVLDSSVIEQNEGLQQVLKETIEQYEKILETASKTGVIFDTVYRDTGSLKVVNKVTFDNGKIKTAEGRILAVSQDLTDKTSELYDAHSTIDSLAIELERRDAQLSKQVTTVTKEVKRTVWPCWLFIVCLAAGLVLEYRFKLIQKIMKKLTFLLLAAIVFLPGCADFKDTPGKSVWSEGLWILPWLTGLGALAFFIIAYLASKSGSTKQTERGITSSDKNVPIYKVGKFWLGVALAVATLAIIISVINNR